MGKPRKRYSGKEKVRIIRRHLLEQLPISKVCEEVGIKPTQFYQWQKEFFERGEVVFERKPVSTSRDRQADRTEQLEAKLKKKDEVLAELMEEYVALKKSLGEI